MDVRLPRLGEGATSGTVVKILVHDGETITKDQPLLEIESEKAIVPIPSPVAGKITQVHVHEGDEIREGQVIVSVEESPSTSEARRGADMASPPPSPSPVKGEGILGPSGGDSWEQRVDRVAMGPAAAPSVRKVASELGIDLGAVRGSERGGRITMGDLKEYIRELQSPLTGRRTPALPSPGTPESVDFSKWGPITRTRMSPLRRKVAERMQRSWTSIPHVTQFDRADITRLLRLRKAHGAEYERRGARLTLTCFILKACVLALKKLPIFNSSIEEDTDEIVYKDYIHINVAVDTEAGLIAPVVRDVDRKSLLGLSTELNILADRTRQRRITLEELQGGSFTVSNLGSIGGTYFSPIISRPQVAVLAVGRGFEEPRLKDGKLESMSVLPLGVSYDHRVIDGADGARFIRAVVDALEQFSEDDVRPGRGEDE